MIWVLLALTAAVTTAARETLIKSVMAEGDAVAISFFVSAVAALLLLGPALASGAGVHDDAFWWALLVSGSVNAAAAVMIARAVHVSDLSLVSPLQSTTPLFMIGTGWLFLGEVPGRAGVLGIGVIVVGAYVLNSQRHGRSLLGPLRALVREPGARLFLGVALIYAVSGAVDKVGVRASGALLWPAATNGFAALLLMPLLWRRSGWSRLRRLMGIAPVRLLVAGVLMSIGIAAQMAALPMTLAAHVIAVKRSSTLFSVLAGGLLFRERALGRRLVGAALMLAGLVVVVLQGR